MKRFWFQLGIWAGVAAVSLALLLSGEMPSVAQAQAPVTDTPPPGDAAPMVTAQEEGANVRTGPSSIIYPVLGRLQPGESARAIAVSPHHEWIEIEYNGATGWVYTAFVQLSPGFLPEVEPPPTPTPLATATFDPTLVAQFNAVPTVTRLPTFTAPPPLTVPSFGASDSGGLRFPMGLTIGAIILLGAGILGISFFGRR